MKARMDSSNLIAVGLQYDERGDGAPTVVVKGERIMADEGVKIARRFNVPVVEEGELARAANEIPIDHQIPKSLFRAVAILLNKLTHS